MPAQFGKDSKGCFVRWGQQGAKYYYECGNDQARKDATQRANKQGAAIHIQQQQQASLILSCSTPPALCLATERTPHDLVRFKKELIKVGEYIKASTGQAFKVTAETIQHWAQMFREWTAAGNKVPIPLGHDRAGEPEANVGWVTNMFADGKSLFGILELIDPSLALTTDVSICVPKEVIDGKGKKYIQPITHVALTTTPVVAGLKDFEALSLSLETNLGDTTMLDLKKLSALLGVEESALTEDLIIAALDPKKVLAPAVTAPAAAPAAPSASLSLSLTTVDPMLVKVVAENRAGKLDTLVRAGLLTPAIRDVITKKYVETQQLTLSLSRGDDGSFDLLMEVLSKNTPTPLGESSGPQLLQFSNPRTEQPNVMKSDVNRRREAAGLKAV